MATRSRIAIELPDGRVKSVYCHWDGSPNTNGRILRDHYQDRKKVEKLIELGSLSSLHENVDPTGPHSFGAPQDGVVVAYHRDRGEAIHPPCVDQGVDSYFCSDVEEYGYLFTKDDKWVYVSDGNRNPRKCADISA